MKPSQFWVKATCVFRYYCPWKPNSNKQSLQNFTGSNHIIHSCILLAVAQKHLMFTKI